MCQLLGDYRLFPVVDFLGAVADPKDLLKACFAEEKVIHVGFQEGRVQLFGRVMDSQKDSLENFAHLVRVHHLSAVV